MRPKSPPRNGGVHPLLFQTVTQNECSVFDALRFLDTYGGDLHIHAPDHGRGREIVRFVRFTLNLLQVVPAMSLPCVASGPPRLCTLSILRCSSSCSRLRRTFP